MSHLSSFQGQLVFIVGSAVHLGQYLDPVSTLICVSILFLCYVAIESKYTGDMDAENTLSHDQSVGIKENDRTTTDNYYPEVFRVAKGVHLRFLYLVAQLKQMLKDYELQNFLDACYKLHASINHSKVVPLIPSDYLENFGNADAVKVFSSFTFLWTWNDHSILRAILEACNCQDGIKMLDEFESQIDTNQPLELFPIPPPSEKMAPSSSSAYTVLSIRCEHDQNEVASLQYVNDVAKIMIERFDLPQHSLQLLAMWATPLMLYWVIPRYIVPLISKGVKEHLDFLKAKGFSEIAIYPNIILFAVDNLTHGSFALLSSEPQVRYFMYTYISICA